MNNKNNNFDKRMRRIIALRNFCKKNNITIVTAVPKPSFDMFANSKSTDFVVKSEEVKRVLEVLANDDTWGQPDPARNAMILKKAVRALAEAVETKPKLTGWLNGHGYTDKFVPNLCNRGTGRTYPKEAVKCAIKESLWNRAGGKAIQHPIEYNIKLKSMPITVKPRKLTAKWTMDPVQELESLISRRLYKRWKRFTEYRQRRRKVTIDTESLPAPLTPADI